MFFVVPIKKHYETRDWYVFLVHSNKYYFFLNNSVKCNNPDSGRFIPENIVQIV